MYGLSLRYDRPMTRYRHYRNFGVGGDTVFITTTCLDFAYLLQRAEMRDRMVERLWSDCAHYSAVLHAYVVMSNHIHFVTRLPEGRASGWFMQRLKTNSTRELLPLLTAEESASISHQQGLDGRQFWKRSYDSLVLRTETIFAQKIAYIHTNPVRACLVEEPGAYAWSSASAFEEGLWDPENGLRR